MSKLLLSATPQTIFTYEVRNDKIVWVDVPQPFKENLLNVDEIMPSGLAKYKQPRPSALSRRSFSGDGTSARATDSKSSVSL